MDLKVRPSQNTSTLTCGYLDHRGNVLPLLAQKLGAGFEFRPLANRTHTPPDSDVLLISVAARNDAGFRSSVEALQKATRQGGPPVIACIASNDAELARELVEAGAYDVFVESSSLEELRIIIRRAVRFYELTRTVNHLGLGTAKRFLNCMEPGVRLLPVMEQVARIADAAVPVLITGESGTGKDRMARTIHNCSHRASQPFLGVSIASIPETLIESELFGHEKGAFTGAATVGIGRFEAAGSGTIFLDEIGDLPLPIQVKLLRVLQEKQFERLGSTQPRPLRARVICATHRNLPEMVKREQFRLDLYYRLNTVELRLPSLRDSREDIPVLAKAFLTEFAQRHGSPARTFSPVVQAVLSEYDWPGNIRELENVVERIVLMCDTTEVGLDQLPAHLSGMGAEVSERFEDEVRRFKRRLIMRALERAQNNKCEAARHLGIARSSLHRLMDDLEIAEVMRTRTSSDPQHLDS
ncbi:MAG TPA: sigma-54 dependent transcriptional regulator [Terriglobales bacterium]|nr:sigma-54 dependent transcriptional regulator [Terriglobales bacterium]